MELSIICNITMFSKIWQKLMYVTLKKFVWKNKKSYIILVKYSWSNYSILHLFSDPNDCIMELLMVCYALKTSCCRKVIGVVPYLPYSKQSKMRNRGSIPAKLMADLLCRAGKTFFLILLQTFQEIRLNNGL